MKIRQIALVAKDIVSVKQTLFTLLGIEQAHVDPKIISFGWQNIVMALGDTFFGARLFSGRGHHSRPTPRDWEWGRELLGSLNKKGDQENI